MFDVYMIGVIIGLFYALIEYAATQAKITRDLEMKRDYRGLDYKQQAASQVFWTHVAMACVWPISIFWVVWKQ